MKYKISKKVGVRIQRIRKRQSLTQEQIAEKLGLHVSSYGRLERGESNPDLPSLEKISRILKVKLSELVD